MFTLDVGVYLEGFHTDYATTVIVGKNNNKENQKFLEIGEKALDRALKVAETCEYLGEISQSIEHDIYGSGYFILHELTGHGIGRDLHEAPYVPGILDRPVNKTTKVQDGLVIAVEVIYSMGTERITHEKGDSWSIVTADGSLSACFEKTIAFFNKKTFILT
jgi:methionyl aminopeptidase